MDPVPRPDRNEARVEALLSAARARDRAPASLRARIERERAAARPARRRAGAFGLGLAAMATAAAALIIALTLPSGTPGSPTISQAAALAQRGAVWPPPGPDPDSARARLSEKVGPVYFPNWRTSVGWWPVGERRDRLGGKPAVTVYYTDGRARVAYTIVGVAGLRGLTGSPQRVGAVWVHSLSLDGRTVVSWQRAGQSCVLSSATVSEAQLARLASIEAPTASS